MFDFEQANKMLENENYTGILNAPEVPLLNPDQACEMLKKSIDIEPFVQKADSYEIANVEQATNALSMALQARKLATALITSKKEITKPQVDYQRAINKLAMDYIERLEEIERNLTLKIESWLDTNTESAFSSGLDSIQVTDGSLKRVSTWCFEIEDSVRIPFEYMCPDMEEIQKAIKSGLRHIPGVKIYLKQEIKLRVKN